MEPVEPSAAVSPLKLKSWLDQGQAVLLIDTLPNDHYQKVHLPGARNACVFEVSFLDQVAGLAPDPHQRIVVYGASAKTLDAATAAAKLVRAGYTNVAALEGGIAQWRSAGFSLEGRAGELPDEPPALPLLENRTYTADTARSLIEWAGRNPNTKHHGTVALASGTITVKEQVISGTFEIDMSTIRNINLEGDELQPVLIDHLLSDDFFFVKRYPKARFIIQSALPADEAQLSAPNYKLKGVLELRGVRAELAFAATVNVLADQTLSAEAHFDIDRTRWKVIYGSSRFFEHLGMHLVYDLISLQVHIVLQ